jgi:hypothetical protein
MLTKAQVGCFGLLIVGRVVNVLLPLTLAKLVEILAEPVRSASPWPYLFGYVGLRYLQSSGGLAAVRDVSVHSLFCGRKHLTIAHNSSSGRR